MPKIRVLIVDDAVVMRKLISEALGKDAEIEVVGTAPNGRIALQKITQVNPDIITLDVEMPIMDGVATLREIRKAYPKLPVIMFSTLTQKGAATTLDALALGANDYVTKPANVGNVVEGIDAIAHELLPKIRIHCKRPLPIPFGAAAPKTPPRPPAPRIARASALPLQVVCVGASTGGPNALADIFTKFTARPPVPILVVQHMPPMFTAMLAQRLTKLSPIPFDEGVDGMAVEPGRGYIAPGGCHMEVLRMQTRSVLRLHNGPPENSCRPAVDVLFRSVAAAYGEASLAVVMTGMGQDGMRGCEAIRARHGQVVIQDEASSVVWGMPGAVAHAGLADRIVPLSQIADEIQRRVLESRFRLAA